MGRKRPDKGGRRGSGRKSTPRDQRRSNTPSDRSGSVQEMAGPSRLLLTKVIREGVIWDVYVATIPRGGSPNLTQLEFETPGPARNKLRHTYPVVGELLEALQSGAPVRRASLVEALDRAFAQAGSSDEGEGPPPS